MKIWTRYGQFEKRPPTDVERAMKAQYYFNEFQPGLPSDLDLALISLREHLDVASQTFFQCLVKSDRYGDWIQKVNKDWISERLSEGSRFQIFVAHSRLPVFELNSKSWSLRVLKALEETGAEVHEFALDAKETLSTNARVLRATLESYMTRDSLIVTLGRSTLEMMRLLIGLKGQFQELEKVKGWISLSGSFKGMELYRKRLKSPLLKWQLQGINFLERQPSESLLELATEFPLWSSEYMPERLPFEVVSIFGVPKQSEVHSSLLSTFRYVSDHGPTDGLNVLSQCLPPFEGAHAYPVWGDDFYLRSGGFLRSLRRMVCGLLESTESESIGIPIGK